MKNHKEIAQKSEDWFRMKWGKIGGTASNGLFVDSETLMIDILSQRCEVYAHVEDSFESRDMMRGNEMEPLARKFLESYLKVEFLETGWLQCESNELLGMSPDGLSEDETIQCEIKCLGRKAHYKILLNDEIPREYIAQCLHSFTVNPKLEELYWIAYRPESPKPFIKKLTRASLLDFGWKKVEYIPQTGVNDKPIKPKAVKTPDVKTIDEWAKISHQKADELLETIKSAEMSLTF
tara:strand:- start:72 stop:779 length:708 start_codon:yes stop_codon:yes gene_type:complete